MTTAHVAGHTPLTGVTHPCGQQPFGAAGRFARTAFGSLGHWLRVRRATFELLRLDDRMLSDIGLSRSTLFSAAMEVERAKDRGYGSF